MPSMYLDEKRPYKPLPPNIIRKRFAGEIIGPYELIKLAGEGPHASSKYWKARCLKCNEVVTINVTRMDSLRKAKGCVNCKGQLCHNQSQTG